MSIDKNKIKKIIGVSMVAIGAAFVGMSILARKKNPSSVYEDDREQKIRLRVRQLSSLRMRMIKKMQTV